MITYVRFLLGVSTLIQNVCAGLLRVCRALHDDATFLMGGARKK